MRAWLVAGGLSLVAGGAACDSPADTCTPRFSFVGTWSYQATQTTPSPATLVGTLGIPRQDGCDFDGTLDVVETDGSGSRPRSGPVSGRVLDSVTVDFDAFLETVARRHVGLVRSDSVVGTWVRLDPGGPPAGGAFAGRRPSP